MLAAILGLLGFFAAAGGRDSSTKSVNSNESNSSVDENVSTVAPIDTSDDNETVVTEEQPEVFAPAEDAVVVVVDPEDETTEPADDPVEAVEPPVSLPTDETPGSTDGPETIAHASFAESDGTIEGGRVTTFELDTEQEISEISVSNMPDNGNVVINADNSIAVVMTGSEYSGAISFDLDVTFADGSSETMTADLTVNGLVQADGWGLGHHYMLEEDENGEIIVETGDNHRPVYVSESDEALTKADIAALEGLEDEDITTGWLIDHPEYGGSEELALSTDIGMDIWENITQYQDNSHWLMFERGYTYESEDLGRLVMRGSNGEDELHPMHISSWGEGERPVIDTQIKIYQEDTSHLVFSEVTLSGGVLALGGENIIFDDVLVTDAGLNLQNVDNVTIHDSELMYIANDTPYGDDWAPHADRSSAMFTANMDGLLIEDSILHQNGWTEGYDDPEIGGQPPSQYSHNGYVGNTTFDLTFKGNIVSQGSSFGLMARGGGYIEDNFFVDNNNQVSFLGGDYQGAGHIGNFTLFADNVMTEGAHKEAESIGAYTMGVHNAGELSTLLDNIVAHIGDPNDPDALAEKWWGNPALINEHDAFYDDTIVYNWDGAYNLQFVDPVEINTDGLDSAVLDQTTIHLYAAALLGDDEATITEFVEYIASLADTEFDDTFDTQSIISYFQNGFEISPNGDEGQTDHTFVANDLGDGVRWDNRINWDTEDSPDDGDSVSLNGNWVEYGATTKINGLDLGSNGKLSVNHGKLTVEGDLNTGEAGGEITTDGAGQFFTDGYADTDRMTFDIDGGRFANTGDFHGTASIDISGGQAILGLDSAEMVLGDDSELRVNGSDLKVGFDGENGEVAVLQMSDNATLSLIADAEGFGTIKEFRSGMFDQDDANVKSGLSLDGTLQVDVTALSEEGTHSLIEVDALDGVLDDIHVHGLANTMNAQFVVDYNTDTVSLELTEGSGSVSYSTVGEAGDSSGESADLWAALTAGQGTYDEGMPNVTDEADEMDDILAA